MLIFLIISLTLCCRNIGNSNVTMKFAQLHYFLLQNIGEGEKYYVPIPPLNSFPVCAHAYDVALSSNTKRNVALAL